MHALETGQGFHNPSCMQARGEGVVLDQFANTDNFLSHYAGTGPELWKQTGGRITHFVSSMGTTGTLCFALQLSQRPCMLTMCSVHGHPGGGGKPTARRWLLPAGTFIVAFPGLSRLPRFKAASSAVQAR